MRGREPTCTDDRGCGRIPPTVSRPCSLSRWLILSSLVWLLGALPAGAASRPAAAEAPVPATPWALVVQGDRLTVELHGVPLGEVLAELARQANLHVTFSEATVSFTDGLLDEVGRQVKWQPSGPTADA